MKSTQRKDVEKAWKEMWTRCREKSGCGKKRGEQREGKRAEREKKEIVDRIIHTVEKKKKDIPQTVDNQKKV